MATTKRPPRALYVTRAALQRAPAEDVLAACALIGNELVRRIKNYAENAATPASLLDGVRFASVAHRINSDFAFGRYPYSLYHAEKTLTRILGGSTWVEDEDDLEGDFVFGDDGDDDA